MSLADRIEALESASKPRKTKWLVVMECDGETLEMAEKRTGIKADDAEFVFIVKYQKDQRGYSC